jgi:hypothetical protein
MIPLAFFCVLGAIWFGFCSIEASSGAVETAVFVTGSIGLMVLATWIVGLS